jgi:uncharacterized protein
MFGAMSWIPDDFLILIGLLVLGSVLSLLSLAWLWVCLPVLMWIGIAVGLVSPDRWSTLARRQAKWHFLEIFGSGGTTSYGSSGSSGSSWSSGSGGFSGGGGSFGGGGSSGSW